MASDTKGSVVLGTVTVKTAVPVTTVPSLGLVTIATMAVAPALSEVAIPVVGSMVATDGLLELQTAGPIVLPLIVTAWPVRFTVEPVPVVPIALKLTF